MNHELYLNRIGITQHHLPATTRTLIYLQQQHLLHVPFENVDINNGVPIELDTFRFYEKIVQHRRGGYCYECNGLFYELLKWLGFEVKMISCRVVHHRHIGPAFDHLALIVSVEGKDWLVDAGFGDFSMKPLALQPDVLHKPGIPDYCIEQYGSLDSIQYLSAGKWSTAKQRYIPLYLFTAKPYALEAFAGRNHFHQTAPESHFTRSLICSIPTVHGRVSLINNRLIIHDGGEKKEQFLYTSAALQSALTQYFGLADTLLVPAG